MAKLREQLERIKESGKTRIPAEARAVMEQATEQLKRSGIAERTLHPGQPAPEFNLPDAEGRDVSSAEKLKTGPLVVSFYRGKW